MVNEVTGEFGILMTFCLSWRIRSYLKINPQMAVMGLEHKIIVLGKHYLLLLQIIICVMQEILIRTLNLLCGILAQEMTLTTSAFKNAISLFGDLVHGPCTHSCQPFTLSRKYTFLSPCDYFLLAFHYALKSYTDRFGTSLEMTVRFYVVNKIIHG